MEDTNYPSGEEVDTLVQDYLRSELNGQLGRSSARFRQHLAGPGAASILGPRRTTGGWAVGIVGAAIAASFAALWAGPALRLAPTKPNTPVVPVAQSQQYHLDLDDVTLSTQTRDGGTVLLDGHTPARAIYRNELKQSRWVDAKHDVSVETIEPRQTIMLIEMDTY
jgi:hypothetical protein